MAVPLERLSRPEYTGENRCWPCTIVNGALLAGVALVLAVSDRRLVAAVVAAVGTVAIALRGYLVPYTPRFAPRLVAALPGNTFHEANGNGRRTDGDAGDADEGGSIAGTDRPDPETVTTALFEAGVVVPDGEELRLEPDFRESWREGMSTLRPEPTATLAGRVEEAIPQTVDVWAKESRGDEYLVVDPDAGVVRTVPRAKAIAELAAVRTLEGRVDDPGIRLAAGRALRPFLDRCPDCGGDLRVATDGCCGPAVAPTRQPPEHLLCADCGARLYTYDS